MQLAIKDCTFNSVTSRLSEIDTSHLNYDYALLSITDLQYLGGETTFWFHEDYDSKRLMALLALASHEDLVVKASLHNMGGFGIPCVRKLEFMDPKIVEVTQKDFSTGASAASYDSRSHIAVRLQYSRIQVTPV